MIDDRSSGRRAYFYSPPPAETLSALAYHSTPCPQLARCTCILVPPTRPTILVELGSLEIPTDPSLGYAPTSFFERLASGMYGPRSAGSF
jgi:hypothetical protein